MKAIGPLARATVRPGADGELGGFGGLFDLKAAGFTDPLLVAATDGVGTKLKIAIECDKHDTVGIDLVAMCVNDLVVQGAEPLFFLDYFASGKLSPRVAESVIGGIAEGCRQAGCALIGGETAEMPGMYVDSDYDLAGFTVGAVERDKLLTGVEVAIGDVVLGLASDGVHANGFSLVRRVVETQGLGYGDAAPFAPGQLLGDVLLTPTRIYVKACLDAVRTGSVRALAHITGGGLTENVPRVMMRRRRWIRRAGLGLRFLTGWPALAGLTQWRCTGPSIAGLVWWSSLRPVLRRRLWRSCARRGKRYFRLARLRPEMVETRLSWRGCDGWPVTGWSSDFG